MYTIIFCEFPTSHVRDYLHKYPRVNITVLSNHETLVESKQYLNSHAVKMVLNKCGKSRVDSCYIKSKDEILTDGISLYCENEFIVNVYEKRGIISEGYIYNSCHTEYRMVGWFEILKQKGIKQPSYEDVIKEMKNVFELKSLDN